MAAQVSLAVLQRKNSEVQKLQDTWERVRILVEEDEAHYASPKLILNLPNEDATKKSQREQLFKLGFFNPARELISAKGDYILRRQVIRNTTNTELKKFIDSTDQYGTHLNDFIRNQVSPILQSYGTVFAVIDKPRGPFESKAAELNAGMPYMYVLHPQQVLNWDWGRDGNLEWFRYVQGYEVRELSPFDNGEEYATSFVTWTKTDYFRHDKQGNLIETFQHGFGMVPVAIQSAFLINPLATLGSTTFFSSSRHIIMGNNHLSIANIEVAKHGSLLMMENTDWDPHYTERKRDPETNLPQLESRAKEAAVLAVSDMSHPPKYLEKNIEIITRANEQAYLYFSMAADAEASGQAPAPIIGNTNPKPGSGSPQSGVAKAYDFQDMDANLFSHAQELQSFEKQILTIAAAELGISNPVFSVQYPSNFDVRGYEEKINLAIGLDKIAFQSTLGIKLAQKQIVPDLTQDPVLQKQIEDEIDAAVIPLPVVNDATSLPVDPNQ